MVGVWGSMARALTQTFARTAVQLVPESVLLKIPTRKLSPEAATPPAYTVDGVWGSTTSLEMLPA